MVVQKALNNLREGPKEDKVAAAGVIAVSVVVILLVAWAIFFFRNIQNVVPVNESGEVQAGTDISSVTDAQQIQNMNSNATELLQQMSVDATSPQTQMQEPSLQLQGGTSQFGSASTTY